MNPLSLVSDQPEDEVDSGVFGDFIVRQRTTVFQLFTGKEEPLLVGRHLFLRLDGQLQILHRPMGSYLGK